MVLLLNYYLLHYGNVRGKVIVPLMAKLPKKRKKQQKASKSRTEIENSVDTTPV